MWIINMLIANASSPSYSINRLAGTYSKAYHTRTQSSICISFLPIKQLQQQVKLLQARRPSPERAAPTSQPPLQLRTAADVAAHEEVRALQAALASAHARNEVLQVKSGDAASCLTCDFSCSEIFMMHWNRSLQHRSNARSCPAVSGISLSSHSIVVKLGV